MPSTEHSGALSAVSDLPQAEHVYVAVTGCATPGTRSSTTGTTSSSSRGCVKASRQSYGPLGGRPTWQTPPTGLGGVVAISAGSIHTRFSGS
jgi:hypothetical protein